MTFHMPPLKVSKNTIHGNTASREYGRKNENEPEFTGDTWVVRDKHGKLIDHYHNEKYVERYYPGTVFVEFFKE